MKKIIFSLLFIFITSSVFTHSAVAEGNIAAGKTKSALCAGCHGATGKNPSPNFPNLAGQHAQYIVKQLKAFKAGTRVNPTMAPMAATLSEQDMADVAAYFASQSRTGEKTTSASTETAPVANITKAPVFVADPGAGKALYELGDESRSLGACIGCHGKDGHSEVLIYPNLAKQHHEYIEKQLHNFKAGTRTSFVMNQFAKALSDDEIKNIGAYLADTKAVSKAKVHKVVAHSTMTKSALAGKEKAAACASCHGADGNSLVAMYPKLAGQSASYLIKQLKEFKDGTRKNAIMAGMSAALSEQDSIDLASYFAAQKATTGNGKSNVLGKKLYFGGDAKRGIPACVACHGVKGQGIPQAGFPAVAGQNAEYLLTQLKSFHRGERANDKNGVMRGVTRKLKDKQAAALVQYMSSL